VSGVLLRNAAPALLFLDVRLFISSSLEWVCQSGSVQAALRIILPGRSRGEVAEYGTAEHLTDAVKSVAPWCLEGLQALAYGVYASGDDED
jgi:hypothetical protein